MHSTWRGVGLISFVETDRIAEQEHIRLSNVPPPVSHRSSDLQCLDCKDIVA